MTVETQAVALTTRPHPIQFRSFIAFGPRQAWVFQLLSPRPGQLFSDTSFSDWYSRSASPNASFGCSLHLIPPLKRG